MSALYYGITQPVRWQHTPDLKRVLRWNVQSILRLVVCRRHPLLLTLNEEEVLRVGVAFVQPATQPFLSPQHPGRPLCTALRLRITYGQEKSMGKSLLTPQVHSRQTEGGEGRCWRAGADGHWHC